jgi:hypothetical protein
MEPLLLWGRPVQLSARDPEPVASLSQQAPAKESKILPIFSGVISGSGTAQTVAGGSATAFNNVSSAGGRGSGSAAGNTAETVDTPVSLEASSNTLSTGVFTGYGSGSYGSVSNRPDKGGSVNGKGSGSGTALVAGTVDLNGGVNGVNINNDAVFNSNGGGSGYVDTANGGALGSASADVSGTATGKLLDSDPPLFYSIPVFDISFSGSAVSNGEGAFAGGFSPTQSSGRTGGSGSGKGSFNVAGAAASDANDDRKVTTVIGSATAETIAGGSAAGFNDLGSAGGLGSGATQGSANGATTPNFRGGYGSDGSGAGTTATGIFNADGSGSFGPTGSLTFP